MRLGARILKQVLDGNNYDYTPQFTYNQGSTVDLYLQLTNLDWNGTEIPGIPYHASIGATLQVVLSALNTANVLTSAATQPFANNTSIWKISIPATANFSSGNIALTLTEGLIVSKGTIINGISVQKDNLAFC